MKTSWLVAPVAVAILTVFVWHQQTRHPITPLGAGIQGRLDSVVVTQPAFDSLQNSEKKEIARNDTALHEVDKSLVQDSIYVKADSQLIMKARKTSDSLTAALSLVGSLTVQNRDLMEKVTRLVEDTLRLRFLYVRDSTRLDAVTRLNRDVAHSVEHINQCKILLIRCPNRTESFILGTLAATAGIVAASK